jgi:hypothetical protein
MAPFMTYCIEQFGPDRCMFESNFPPDKAISQKEFPYAGCWYRIEQHVVLGPCRMALPSCCNRRHRRLTECQAFLGDFVAARDDRMPPLPGPPLGPRHHRLCLEPRRPMPLQCQETPAPLDGMIWAGGRRRIPPRHRLGHGVGSRHHTREQWGAPATALRTLVPVDLEQPRGSLLWCIPSVPLGFAHLHDAVPRFGGAAQGEGQLCALFLDDPTGARRLLASPLVLTALVGAPGATTACTCADVHRSFPSPPPSFDAAG